MNRAETAERLNLRSLAALRLLREEQIVRPDPERVVRIEGAGVTMGDLIDAVTDDVERRIVDRGGFTERFDFSLELAAESTSAAAPLAAPRALDIPSAASRSRAAAAPSLSAATRTQLGPDIRATRADVDVLVIVSAERPSAN